MTQHEVISKKLRISGILVIAGLLVEALSLVWNHPLSLVAFLGIGGLLLAAGILLYLWALVSPAT
jgi:hypothetical protein